MSDEEQSRWNWLANGFLNLSESERQLPDRTYGHVMRDAAAQSVHDPNKLVDFAAYRQKARERQLMNGYRANHPNRPPRNPAA